MSLRRAMLAGAITAGMLATGGWAFDSDPLDEPQPGTSAWVHDAAGRPDPRTAPPAAVAAYFAGLPQSEQDALAARYPAVVGNLDGAPIEARYAANSVTAEAAGLDPSAQLLALDPRGRGAVVEVLGDLSTADRIAVVVPGNDVDLAHFAGPERPLGMAEQLYAAAEAEDPGSLAVVAWAGYRTPAGLGLDAARGTLAEAGAERLTRFVAGLSAHTSAPISLFCHSYGSVVCGLAAPGLDAAATVDNLVAFGSPGMRVDSAVDLHTAARVWVARADSDWIGDIPHFEFLGIGHGPDPMEPEFGATAVSSDGVQNHGGYFADGTDSLRNFVHIALGEYGAVELATKEVPADASR